MNRIKNNKIVILLVIIIAAVSILTSCTKCKTITLATSNKAKEHAKKVEAEKSNRYFMKEYFGDTLKLLDAGIPNVIADAEVKNTLAKETCNGSDVYTLDAEGTENVVLYIHGGGWIFGIDPLHVKFCDKLVSELNAKVYMPLYPLAPKATYREMYAMLEVLYDKIKDEGKTLYVMGDSAGGNLALGLMHQLKEKGSKMPDKLALLSPASDITFTNKEIDAIEPEDICLAKYGAQETAKMYAGDKKLTDPLLNPLYSDTKGYPDTIIFTATKEIVAPDNILMAEKMNAEGVNVTLVISQGLWHTFSLSDIPEGDKSIELIKEL